MVIVFWLLAATTVSAITISTEGKFTLNGHKLYTESKSCYTVEKCLKERELQWIKK